MNTISIPNDVELILDKIENAGYEAYVVGGCVRDSLLNKVPHDWDITTSALPEDIERIFNKFRIIETGLKHGTVTVVLNNEGYEITTYRIDGDYSDGRHPDTVKFSKKLCDDLSRRDFTMNAIAFNPNVGFVDPFDGRRDIENKVVRCVGNPKTRFNEDALRILRTIRFACQLNFDIEQDTSNCLDSSDVVAKLLMVSRERVQQELMKMIVTDVFPDYLETYTNVFFEIIPELRSLLGFNQFNRYHCFDVFHHTVESLRHCIDDPVVKLALLFHDIGKPNCFQQDMDGTRHFKGHPAVSANIALDVLKRLRFDNDTINKVVELVKYHDISLEPSKSVLKKRLNRFGEEQLTRLFDVRRADIMAQSHMFMNKRLDESEQSRALAQEILKEECCFKISNLKINGSDLLNLGYPPCKALGDKLNEILDKVINEELPNERDVLLAYANNKNEIRTLQVIDKLIKHGVNKNAITKDGDDRILIRNIDEILFKDEPKLNCEYFYHPDFGKNLVKKQSFCFVIHPSYGTLLADEVFLPGSVIEKNFNKLSCILNDILSK